LLRRRIPVKLIAIAAALALLVGLGCSSGDEATSQEAGSAEIRTPTATAQRTPAAQVEPDDGSMEDEPASEETASGQAASPVTAQGTPTTPMEPDDDSMGDESALGESASNEQDAATVESQRDVPQAVVLQPGQVYSGPMLVTEPALEVTFEIPEGWSGGIPQGSVALLLGSQTMPGLVMAAGQQSADAAEVVAVLSQAVPLSATSALMPQAQPRLDGEWVRVQYAGYDGADALAGFAAALVHPERKGILYVVAGPTDEADYFLALINDLVASTVSGTAVTQAATDPSGDTAGGTSAVAKEWTDYLAGRLMTYMSSYSSGGEGSAFSSSKREMYLCRDGRFAYESESSVSVDVEGVSGLDAGGGSDSGQWRIITQGDLVGIEFTWSSGQTSQHQLDYVNGETLVDGERWFVTDDNPYC
jgi:hypothetical protein